MKSLRPRHRRQSRRLLRPRPRSRPTLIRSHFMEVVPEDHAPVPIPITGELDLHTFQPSDLGALIPAYFDACIARGIYEVRVVHGKGTGTLRTTVHALLRRLPCVQTF